MTRSGSRPGKTSARAGRGGPNSGGATTQRAVRALRGGGSRGPWIGTAIVVVVAVVVIGGVLLTRGGDNQQDTASTNVPEQPIRTATGRATQPPWSAPVDPSRAVQQAKLPMLSSEGVTKHIHAHLDVLVDGKPVPVPSGIGIDEQGGRISPVHAHDGSGVIHIESPVDAPFSLGQFFTEWQVALSAKHLGGLQAGNGKTLRAYVNGKPVSGNPAAITLRSHDEIALVYGPANAQPQVPKSYRFSQGE